MSTEWIDFPWMTPSEPNDIPLADCGHCDYRDGGNGMHCYMFRDKPGDRCGQFKRAGHPTEETP